MRTTTLLQRLLVALLALHAAAATKPSSADLVSEALRLHVQSTVLPTHLLEDQQLFSGRHLLSDSRKLQAVGQEGRYVLIKNPTMQGVCVCAEAACIHASVSPVTVVWRLQQPAQQAQGKDSCPNSIWLSPAHLVPTTDGFCDQRYNVLSGLETFVTPQTAAAAPGRWQSTQSCCQAPTRSSSLAGTCPRAASSPPRNPTCTATSQQCTTSRQATTGSHPTTRPCSVLATPSCPTATLSQLEGTGALGEFYVAVGLGGLSEY